MLMLLKCYPWLLDDVLNDGRRRFMENKKNYPVLNKINEDFFETNIFCRRDIPVIDESAFEQLNLDDMILDFPEPVSSEVV